MQAERDAAGQILAGNTPVTCRHSRSAAAKADGVATAAKRGTQRASAQAMDSTAEGMPSFVDAGQGD